jgi:hypothetical protein
MGSHFAPLPNKLREPETKNILSSVGSATGVSIDRARRCR